MSQQTKRQPLPLRIHSRVRVVSVVIRADDSPALRHCLLRRLNMVGTVVTFDPRHLLNCRINFDDGDVAFFRKESLEVLEP